MPAPSRAYSRVYLDLVDDPMFADVYPDDATFGTWAKLLMLADASWPTSASLPHGISRARLAKLTATGLVTVTGVRFRVRGMDKEREARSARGKAGAEGRWGDATASGDPMPPHPRRNADALLTHPDSNAAGMPRREETRQEEKRTDKPSRDGMFRITNTKEDRERDRAERIAHLREKLENTTDSELREAISAELGRLAA